MNTKTVRDVKLKNGEVIAKGTPLKLAVGNDRVILATDEARETTYRLSMTGAHRNFGSPFQSMPSVEDLEDWGNDGVCESVTGERVEPDGYGSDGFPSWMLALGMI
jgi:hypothetical protein